MLTCQRHRQEHRDSDCGSEGLRPCPRDSGLWHRLLRRSDSWRTMGRSRRRAAEQLLQIDGHQDEPGVRRPWDSRRWNCREQWCSQALGVVFALAATAILVSCTRANSAPDIALDEANRGFVRGDLEQSRNKAREGYERFRHSDPIWAWKFTLLEAKVTLWQGLFEDVLRRLE